MGRDGPCTSRAVLLTPPELGDYRGKRMKRLEDMCSGIQRVLEVDDAREHVAARNHDGARVLAGRFPLTHRTPGGALKHILSDGRLHAKAPCTERELECGVGRALYFFLGCAAYPEGTVAFLAPVRVLERMAASYSPFDSGSLSKFACPRDPLAPWSDPEKLAFLESHLGEGADAVAFCAEYVAAHFENATDYVSRPQRSEPDFPAYHGLVSTSGDRRAWSIEVRLHEDLPLDTEHVEAIVIGQADLFAEFSDDLAETVIVAEDEAEVVWKIQEHILREAAS
jgi:hypothetical protein